jgi:ABC-type glycerol-3-phosphate transport system substrate-binding protein
LTRPNLRRLAVAATLALSAALPALAQTKVEVIHWWTSGSEAGAIKAIADAYRATGGVWVDTSVAISEQARAVAVNRIVGGNPPAVAQFNTTKQFHDLVEEGLLAPIDDVANREGWDKFLPELVLNSIRVKGHYYAAPVNIHSTSWFWFSMPALKKAGVPVFAYGSFITVAVNFIILAFIIFMMVKQINRLRPKVEEAPASTEPPPTPEDIVLLREIRDSLRK